MEKEYDYIICGGGTSGCVVAARLSDEADAQILIIEAGDHNKDLENVHMAGGIKHLKGNWDWNITTTPQPQLDNREISLLRGRFLGGTSGRNGTLCVRGCKQDYDDWDLPGWSGDEFFEAMKRSETFHGIDWFEAAPDAHGTDGPLHIAPYDVAPISKHLMQSFKSKGFPIHHDMFSTGDTPFGCGHAPRTVYNGSRTTGADFVTNERHRDNITILVNTVVDKVNFSSESGIPKAVSVDLVGLDGTRSTVAARREIIISGGAYCSPPILMRSGIGPAEELAKHDIPLLIDAPGVGQNLLDHLIVMTIYQTDAGLTLDDSWATTQFWEKAREQWRKDKTGALADFPFGILAYARLDEQLKNNPQWQEALAKCPPGRDPMGLTPKQPHVEFFNTEIHSRATDAAPEAQPTVYGFGMLTELFSPRSSGTVTLKSKDPSENPIVDHNYLSNPLDLLVLTEGVRLGNEIVMQGSGTKDVIRSAFPDICMKPEEATAEDFIPWTHMAASTCYHPGGTCKMGKESDKFAVLDEKLRVRGVEGLRVIDVSVMPTLHSGHTQMPAYGIGERGADFIKESWESRGV